MDFRGAPRRGRYEARLLERVAPLLHHQHGRRKTAAIGAMTGTVVELGPGTGANMRYYPPGVKVIAIEPNPAMHDRLTQAAAAHAVELEIRELRGEKLDIEDDSVDGVVATMVLCGVDNPPQVIAEIQRVLKPGATYFFLEHVVAPPRTGTRALQRVFKIPHRWVFNGCEVDRDTAGLLQASRFADLEFKAVDSTWRGAYVRHHIIGTACKPG